MISGKEMQDDGFWMDLEGRVEICLLDQILECVWKTS